MTQVFDEKGDVHPITVLQAGPCVVTQLKTLAKDGYDAAQIGLVEFVKSSKVNKPHGGALRQEQCSSGEADEGSSRSRSPKRGQPAKVTTERRARPGDQACWSISSPMRSYVDVIGTSKGRGFAGVVRRHGFGGGPKSHGHMFQVQGSIGASSFPSRVFPGQSMPGHMGVDKVTVRNLRIRGIDLEENLIMVEGAVPGPKDGYVLISKAKAPPRERRGFAGAGTVDPLKASKKASASKSARRNKDWPSRHAPCRVQTVRVG